MPDGAPCRSSAEPHAAVGAIDQVVSAYFVPERREFWVSNGWAPTASNGKYVHFSFDDLADLAQIDARSGDQDIAIADILAGTANDLARWPAFSSYQAAALAADQNANYNPEKSLTDLDQAVSLEPDEPLLRLLRGLMRLKAGHVAEGCSDLDRIHGTPMLDPHRRHLVALYRAKALDVLGRRDEAVGAYCALAQDPCTFVKRREVAAKYVAQPCRLERLAAICPDPEFFDTISYD